MHREFSIVRVKQEAAQWEFPLSWDELDGSPLAGPFNQLDQLRLDVALGCFPGARRTRDGRRAWRISSHVSVLEAWITSDGGLFLDGDTSLELVHELFVHLSLTQRCLVLEDAITGAVHNEQSLAGLVRREEAISVPFELPEVAA